MLCELRGLRRGDPGPAAATLIDALAAFRLTRLVTTDILTNAPRSKFQEWALSHRHPMLYELSSCSWCAGFWISAGVVAARIVAPKLWNPLALALAFSAVAGILSEAT